MNERLTELYRSCRSKEALVSQEQYQSADVLLGTEVEKFAKSIIQECARVYWSIDDGDIHTKYVRALKKHFGVEDDV